MKKSLIIAILFLVSCTSAEKKAMIEANIAKQAEATCVLAGFKKGEEKFDYCLMLSTKQLKDARHKKEMDNYYRALDSYNMNSGFTCHHMGAFTTCN